MAEIYRWTALQDTSSGVKPALLTSLELRLLVTAYHSTTYTMRLFSTVCVLLWTLFTFVTAKSAVGDRLLVVLEDTAEKESYSQLWKDLECEQLKFRLEGMGIF